ncbi:MAG: hypothetical protein A3F84_04385 [Candidatus Handelsmanbacteria bacterium RIFCSPLOWO2_12_FULL_64_10]|uniref:Uncharacterized protein n=1 Tax=Handelsmanbacteria sp. (strain RIFCSPLOWO2_12_FULL_64_10) TaxID=1817868 RepID=A0A1F6D349_HANXR|nr:MAG: hypothetical protein A3F84_04385 [Candidatus Handelsmanbacteria bacterium RIFCSPLOWO2_12_FULL_64_10]
MDIYRSLWTAANRLKPGVWIESGYEAPVFARGFAHSWRLAADYPAFSNPYPFAGLLEQVTYAVAQWELLGRRAHVGFVYGGPETLDVQRQWLAAAVALQAQATLSVDLANTSSETARLYREYLAAHYPFQGSFVTGPGLAPDQFSTTLDGTTYLGLLNRGSETTNVTIDPVVHGLIPGRSGVAFDPSTRESFTLAGTTSVPVPPASFRLLVLRQDPGVVWADRSWSQTGGGSPALTIELAPSPLAEGHLWVYARRALMVSLDDQLTDVQVLDPLTGVLSIEFFDGDPHRVQITSLAP